MSTSKRRKDSLKKRLQLLKFAATCVTSLALNTKTWREDYCHKSDVSRDAQTRDCRVEQIAFLALRPRCIDRDNVNIINI